MICAGRLVKHKCKHVHVSNIMLGEKYVSQHKIDYVLDVGHMRPRSKHEHFLHFAYTLLFLNQLINQLLRFSYKLAFLRWNCLVWPLTEIITACISTSISHYASRQIFEQRYGNMQLHIYSYVFITAGNKYEIIP